MLKGNEDVTFEEGLQLLQTSFRNYMKTQVISKVDVEDLGNRIFVDQNF